MSRRITLVSLCLAWMLTPCGIGVAQEPTPIRPDELAKLHKTLSDKDIAIEKREQILRAFLKNSKERALDADERKKLLVRLAKFELAVRKPREALEHFKEAEAACAPGAKDLYIRASCRLGIAQSHELLGHETEAMQRYAEVRRRFLGMPHAREASAALARLRVKQRIAIGRTVTFPRGTESSRGRRVRAATGKEPTILVFMPRLARNRSPSLPKALGALDSSLRLRIVVSASREDARRWWDFLKTTDLASRTVVTRDRLDAALGVASLPTWLLLDKDAKILEINPTKRRLEAIFRERR